MATERQHTHDTVKFGEAQLILAEKRTSLAAIRTGIAVCALPLSVLGLLIATSQYYEIVHVLSLLIPLVLFCGGLLGLSGYLIIRAAAKIHHQDRLLGQLKARHSNIAEYLN